MDEQLPPPSASVLPKPGRKCAFCSPQDAQDSTAVATCLACDRDFCLNHQSVDDPILCCACKKAVITEKPLVDDEGVTHNGRQLELVGEGWVTSANVISKGTDDELRSLADKYRSLIHDAQRALDTRRIKLALVEMELEEREHARSRHRRKTNPNAPALPTGEVKKIGTTAKPRAAAKTMTPQDLAELMKKAGLTMEMVQKLFGVKKGG